jgi:Putative MetA-pathway of phenol degradation
VTALTSHPAASGHPVAHDQEATLMKMTSRLLLVACVLVLNAGAADAQNFLMNSAETINKGNFKLCAFPTVLLGEDDAENEWGLASRLGYGFTPSFDVEVKLAKFDSLTMYGADGEWWAAKGKTDVSLSLGAHKSDFDGGGGSTAIDTAVIASRSVGDNLEAYVGGSLSFESIDDVDDSSFKRFYLSPGVEYKLGKDIDLLAEFGLGLNDDSPNYFSFGAAYYIR